MTTLSRSATALDFLPDPAIDAAPDPRSKRLRYLDAALTAAWRHGLASEPSLDPGALIARAEALTGRSASTGDGGWRRRLEALCDDLHGVARLTPLGRTIAHGQLVATLTHRLRIEALWALNPQILDRPLPPVVLVVGQMRSGTTRMQRLLACDPAFSHTRFYESWVPTPSGRRDDRPLRARVGLVAARLLNPAFDAIHPTHHGAPDEEIGLQNLSIFGSAFEAQWRVPTFAAAVEADAAGAYAEFRCYLQTIAWLRGRRDARPWVLKVPQFTQDLEHVLRTFPDARLVCVSREPAAVIASSASLVHNQMRAQSAAVDRAWIGQEWMRKVRLRADRRDAALRGYAGRQVHVRYEDVDSDWEGEMRRVYRALGVPLSCAAVARMRRYVDDAARQPFRGHVHALEDWGLTPAMVADVPR